MFMVIVGLKTRIQYLKPRMVLSRRTDHQAGIRQINNLRPLKSWQLGRDWLRCSTQFPYCKTRLEKLYAIGQFLLGFRVQGLEQAV